MCCYLIGVKKAQGRQRKQRLESFTESFKLTIDAINQRPLCHQLQDTDECVIIGSKHKP